MRRAITRFFSLLGNHYQAEIWKVASAVLEAFVSAKLEVTLNRKRLLADFEKMLRLVVSKRWSSPSMASRSPKVRASAGQTSTHTPQPVQSSGAT